MRSAEPCSNGSGVVSDCGRPAEFAVWVTLPSGKSGMVINKCGPCADGVIKRFAEDDTRTVNKIPMI